jgi:hypothetical protein
MPRRFFTLGAALVVSLTALAFGVTSAFAANARFINAHASVDSRGNLVATWKETGLGDTQLIAYTASANAAATWVCVNGGGANSSASNKTMVTGPVSASGTFSSGKNGNVTASLAASPPSLPLFCPGNGSKNGQQAQLAMVTYTDMTLGDETNHITASLGTVSSGCLLPKVKDAC